MPSKYFLNPPDDLHSLTVDSSKRIYPDFDPWRHTPIEDKVFLNFVSKGYYNTAKVNFESISSRSSLQESLPAVSGLLADQLSEVVKIREEQVNRVSAKPRDPSSTNSVVIDLCGPGFTLPKRVTLTDHKRELWLQEVSSPSKPLAEAVKTIPHGLKRRQLLEQCSQKQIPIARAIWLIKCCYTLEWKMSTSKQSPQKHDEISVKLLREWSEAMAHILERLVFEMMQYYNEPSKLKKWRQRIAYFLKLLGSCYSLEIIERDAFHHWLVDFVAKVENFECLPMTLYILSVFWSGIFKENRESQDPQQQFLVNKMTETLIYKYYMVSTSKFMINDEQYLINDVKKNNKLSEAILSNLKALIKEIFHKQSMEAFIFPSSNWEIYKNCLYEILSVDKTTHATQPDLKTSKKLELIVYRNDSLKFNTILHAAEEGSCDPTDEPSADLESIFRANKVLKLKHIDYGLTKMLDDNSAGDHWMIVAAQKVTRIDQVMQIILWAIHPSRYYHYEAPHLVAKLFLLQINFKNTLLESGLEEKIWSLIFLFGRIKEEDLKRVVNLPRLHQLLNVFIGYGIIKVPTYIRKLISSGVLYLAHSEDKFFHCRLLINLKTSPVMKSQYNMVLRNVIDANPLYYERFNYDKLMEMLENSKDSLLDGNFDFIKGLPYSVRLLTSEWYLNRICSPRDGVLAPVTKEDVVEKLNVFCINLDMYHQFYKWIEFIVYHKLLKDLESLECLADILIYYDKLFCLLINDHVLLTKTILHLYFDKLISESPESQSLILLTDFWTFVMTRFPQALEIDPDLQAKLVEAKEYEKTKIENAAKISTWADQSHKDRSIELSGYNGDTFNFPSVFQPNLKAVLVAGTGKELQLARKNMRILMAVNSSEYNKFMSIFLKRKTATNEELAKLISLKVLSWTSIAKVLGNNFLIGLLETSFHEQGVGFELQKKSFKKHNLKILLKTYCEALPQNYDKLLEVLAEHCSSKMVQEYAIKIFSYMDVKGGNHMHRFANDLLDVGVSDSETEQLDDGRNQNITDTDLNNDCDITEDEEEILDFFPRLDFSNLWIFQAITCHYLQNEKDQHHCAREDLARFILESMRMTDFDFASSRLFDKVTNANTLQKTLEVLEIDFLKDRSNQDLNDGSQYSVVVETIINISRRLNKAFSGIIPLSEEAFNLLHTCCKEFASKTSEQLSELEFRLDVFLKIFIVHQKYIVEEGLQNSQLLLKDNAVFIKMLCILFHKIDFSLKLKLLLYDLLSSLKAFAVYSPPGKDRHLTHRLPFQVPQELLDLPPFQISSFMPDENSNRSGNESELGIEESKTTNTNNAPQYFIFNRKTETFDARFVLRPYHLLGNFQEAGPDFNNTCLNLCLFKTVLDRRNPT
ncbi:LAME_0H15654g1_1 [Lachancea meyersii CBS 8951]|uniref:Mediator of RNA polymerase II transcription subunit 12 n=1 Tax=Lachancea meyersii CBS 8951 TaxID=1266667 RepID=A0A1G4KHP0_9SACH|nr:LAME_0H15654g1_1 [Lachancea meyersii CBS 8951]